MKHQVQRKLAVWYGSLVVVFGMVGLTFAAGVAVLNPPQHGTAVSNGQIVRYTPDPNFTGSDGFVCRTSNVPVEVLNEGQTQIEFNDNPKVVEIPVSLTIHPDGTRTVKFGR